MKHNEGKSVFMSAPLRAAAVILCLCWVNSLSAQGGNANTPAATASHAPATQGARRIGVVPLQQNGTPTGEGVVLGNQISYSGGPVMLGPHNVYLIWYGNWSGNTATTILPQFVRDLNNSLYFKTNVSYGQLVLDGSGDGHILSEGNIANTVSLGGQIFDSYSHGSSLTLAQVQDVVNLAITNGLPTDGNGIYFVLTSSDVTATTSTGSFCNNFCGYHTYGSIHSGLLKFSFVGNVARCLNGCAAGNIGIGPNGNAGADGMANVMAHELNETVTDPLLNAWFAGSTAGEVGDLCNFHFGTEFTAPNGAPANVTLNGHNYLIQQNWVNAGGGSCQLSYGASGTPASGTMAITGSIFCDSGGAGCDEGTISVTINTTTETVSYDGLGFNGFGSVQAIAQGLASAFNSDPNSPVTASAVQGPILAAGYGDNWQILFAAKTNGAATNYGMSGSINSFFPGSFPSNLAITSNPLMTGGNN